MYEYYANWYQAIFIRRSRRQYNGQPLPENIIYHLPIFCENLNNIIKGSRVVFVNTDTENVFRGIIGSYGKIKGSPAYAAFIGDMADPNVQEKTGYLGESFILEATYQSLSTCWVGGFFNYQVVKEHIKLHNKEQVLAVTPIGYTSNNYSVMERVTSGMVSGHKRKSLDKLCLNYTPQKWPKWVNNSLSTARLAPSAMNRQPWRFAVEDDSITVSVDKFFPSIIVSPRLDCGIAMLHLEIGAYQKGITGKWEYLKHPEVARFWRNQI
ncbi:MAG: hypothetical protein DDT42_02080 [candidate division WS2 bacterium]|uniref:Putative nitroreductase TM1586 domain-containing protein n=1 Tax=Psychracetigena formicireducens TaxID=2986056 RepID=A0A9E2BIH2_PSYF1|nr:hypothetical protein [Candidatus Psychracetigena formicireducens]MBT9146198.1 hypothetical protein [Candidatus Psychracetigena formicireducens]